jgi:PAS domain S-box-containing protein
MKLTSRFTLATVALVAATAVALSALSYYRLRSTLLSAEMERVEHRTKEMAQTLNTYVGGVRADVLALRGVPAVPGLMEARGADGKDPRDGTPESTWRNRLAEVFVSEMQAKPQYVRISFVGAPDGMELVRVDRSGSDRAIRVLKDEELASKADRPYVVEGLKQPGDAVYIAPIDFSPQGAVDGPVGPLLRGSVPVRSAGGELVGVLSIAVDMQAAFDTLQTAHGSQNRIYLVDADGRFLIHPDGVGEIVNRAPSRRVADEFGDMTLDVRAERSAARTTVNRAGQGAIVASVPVQLAGGPRVALLQVAPLSAVLAPAVAIRQSGLLAGAIATLIALVLAIVVARSSPFVRMSAAVTSSGGLALASQTTAGGEVGVLARAFDRLAQDMRSKSDEAEREAGGRQRAEAELVLQRDRERILSAVVESSNDAILALTPDGLITACNPAAEKLYGLASSQLIGKSFGDLALPDRRYENDALMDRVRSGESIARYDTQHVCRLGRHLDVSVSLAPVRAEDGHIVGVALAARDITDRKQAEDRFRLVVESAPNGLVLADASGAIVLVNAETERLFGYRREQLIGQPVELLVPAELREVHVKHREQFHAHPSTRRMGAGRDLFGRRADGTEFPVEVGLNPLHTPAGTFVLGTIVDITARKEAEDDNSKLESRLRQSEKLEAIGQLAGGVAHDFNNILTAILGYVETAEASLQGGGPLPTSDLLLYMDQIKKSSLWAADLTRRLLAFGRRQVSQPRPFNLNESMRTVEPMLRRLMPENVTVTLSLAEDLHAVIADPSQMEQVIINLVVNARDAMPTGGKIMIRTDNIDLDDAYTTLHPEARPGPYAAMIISDVGCGMDPQTLERIFDPFFTTKEVGHGTGMGLSTVYGIVKQAQGQVTVYSELGKGTTFKVFLPAVESRDMAARPAPVAVEPMAGTETILVAEDNELVRWVIQNVLRTAGYTVILAPNGASALKAALDHAGKINLLITDVVMPGMHGRELAEQLAAHGMVFKVMFVSGYTADVIAHHGVLEPGLALLEKPFTRQSLLHRVRQVLDSPSMWIPGAGSADEYASRE